MDVFVSLRLLSEIWNEWWYVFVVRCSLLVFLLYFIQDINTKHISCSDFRFTCICHECLNWYCWNYFRLLIIPFQDRITHKTFAPQFDCWTNDNWFQCQNEYKKIFFRLTWFDIINSEQKLSTVHSFQLSNN